MQAHEHARGSSLEVDRGATGTYCADAPPVAKPIRVEPAFGDTTLVRALFDRNAPYRAAAAFLPAGDDDTVDPSRADAVNPWFRETWALGGKALAEGAEKILGNRNFLEAAHMLFPSAAIVPKLVVVNVNGPTLKSVAVFPPAVPDSLKTPLVPTRSAVVR